MDELVNRLAELPSVVLVLAVVGLGEVLQHIPLTVIAPPLLVIVPPHVAEVEVMEETVLVDKDGIVEVVVKTC